jgi:hypothetical protein
VKKGAREFLTELIVNPVAAGVFALGALVVAIVSALSSPAAAAAIAAVLFLSVVAVLTYALVTRDRFGGPYEVLSEEITWDLVEPDGSEVIVEKSRDVRFLQNNSLIWMDYAWGDGEIMAEYECSPGDLVDRFNVGDRLWLIISLKSARSRGDPEKLTSRRKVRDGFRKGREWVSWEIVEKTHHLKLSIVFPEDRACRTAYKSSKRGPHLGQAIDVSDLPYASDGRRMLVINEKRLKVGDIRTITWEW